MSSLSREPAKVPPVAINNDDSSMLDERLLAQFAPVRELVVDKAGLSIGKHSARLRVSRKSEIVQEVPLLELKQVLVTAPGVSFSSDALAACAERGIAVYFMDYSGRIYASLGCEKLVGTVRTRREQLLAYADGRGVRLARAFARGKIHNQLNLLRYMSKNKPASPELRAVFPVLEELAGELKRLEGKNTDAIRPRLLAIEARAARIYWTQAGQLVKSAEGAGGWKGRQGQGATDLVNCLLNYGYGIMYTRVEQAIRLAGLDPYGGFVHTDRPGKPSLVYDLIEEFRQPVVDRTVFALVNLRPKLTVDEGGRLDADTRNLLAKKIFERLYEGYERYEGNKRCLQDILQGQAHHIATFVRGERPSYEPFIAAW
jgi:CRISP-associated protein Cas1